MWDHYNGYYQEYYDYGELYEYQELVYLQGYMAGLKAARRKRNKHPKQHSKLLKKYTNY